MASKIEDVLIRLRSKLNEDKVKLWLPPYYDEISGSSDSEIQNLALIYSQDLQMSMEHCLAGIRELQNNAMEKLSERNRFKATGVATLKIRVPGQNGGTTLSTITITLKSNGEDLKNALAQQISSRPERLKLICQGKVLRDDTTLEAQNVKNGMQMMAVILYENVTDIHRAESQQKEVESTRADLQLLAAHHKSYLQLEDQSGNIMEIPRTERKALVTALAFQEKGKAALKKDDYSLALVMFLESDREFSQCNSKLLDSADNYALLNLDIAWCYLCLRSVGQIPDAEARLKKCQDNFHRTYGPNLERLIALKGTAGNEACLFFRLHLLQGVVLFHKNQRQQAKEMLKRAERELKALKVSDENLSTLVHLGYSPAEARLGLRATHHDVNAAADYITRSREERAKMRLESLENTRLKRERKKLGICADGKQYIEPTLLQKLIDMGYPRELARVALGEANNIISNSVQLIQEQPEILQAMIAIEEKFKRNRNFMHILDSLGLDREDLRLEIEKHDGDVEATFEALKGASGSNVDQANTSSEFDESTSEDTSYSSGSSGELEREAYDRFTEGLSMVDDDHLDYILKEEEEFLEQYKKLLE